MAEGKFRQDLYYRINVMQIESPPLQEHPEDIPVIARHFLHHYGQIFQKPMEDIESGSHGNAAELPLARQRARA